MTHFYVISPVASDTAFADKRVILEEAGGHFGLHPFFPLDNAYLSKADLLASIRSAALVIADMSFERPSCYFELGLAEGINASVSLLATTGTHIHQVGDRPVHFYSSIEQYRERVLQILRTYHRSRSRPGRRVPEVPIHR